MNEREWTAVVLAFTDLFDKLKKIAPEQINIDKSYVAGKILQDELKIIRRNDSLRRALRMGFSLNRTVTNSWQKQNEELEKKKEAQRAAELGDLTEALKLSIEKADRDRQGE
jgi:hypothetical protein